MLDDTVKPRVSLVVGAAVQNRACKVRGVLDLLKIPLHQFRRSYTREITRNPSLKTESLIRWKRSVQQWRIETITLHKPVPGRRRYRYTEAVAFT